MSMFLIYILRLSCQDLETKLLPRYTCHLKLLSRYTFTERSLLGRPICQKNLHELDSRTKIASEILLKLTLMEKNRNLGSLAEALPLQLEFW